MSKWQLYYAIIIFQTVTYSLHSSAQGPILFGMTSTGGKDNYGTIFSYNLSTNTEKVAFAFNSQNISENPFGNLVYDSVNHLFYGMAEYHSGGSIFSFNPINNNVSLLIPLNGPSGSNPRGSLVYNDSSKLFYGMTPFGGLNIGHGNGAGVIFYFNSSNGNEWPVWDFGGGYKSTDGEFPLGNLVYDNINHLYYGMTSGGWLDSLGTIISFNPSTKAERVDWIFGKGTDGSTPYGSLVYCPSNQLFYGMTLLGGKQNDGVILSFNPVTNKENVVWDFGDTNDGQFPYGSPLWNEHNQLLYGMTYAGGKYGSGIIYSFNPANDSEKVLWNFGDGTDGKNPYADLIYDTATKQFYGMTVYGGTFAYGSLFSYNLLTGLETILWSFGGNSSDGKNPFGDVVVLHCPVYHLTFSGKDSACSGEYANIKVSGANNYVWSNGDTGSSVELFAPGITSIYTVSIFTGACLFDTTCQIITNPTPVVTISDKNDTLTAKGAIQYLWNTGSTDAYIIVHRPGTYWVTGTNAFGCINTAYHILTSIEEINNKEAISIYPNPASDLLKISSNDFIDANTTIAIITIFGEVLIKEKIAGNTSNLELDVSGIPNGLYFLKIHSLSGDVTSKFAIIK